MKRTVNCVTENGIDVLDDGTIGDRSEREQTCVK